MNGTQHAEAIEIEGVWFDTTLIGAPPGQNWKADCKIKGIEQRMAKNNLIFNRGIQPHEVSIRFKDGTSYSYFILIRKIDDSLDDLLRLHFVFS